MDLCIAILTSTHHTMAQAKQTYAFIFYAPDYTDEGALDRRLAVRQQHLANAKIVKEQGILSVCRVFLCAAVSKILLGFGGALLSPDTYQSEQKKLIGSAGIYEAESIDVVRKIIEGDIYYTSGVVSDFIHDRPSLFVF